MNGNRSYATEQPLTTDGKNYRKTYTSSNGHEQKRFCNANPMKTGKKKKKASLTTRISELKSLPHAWYRISRSKPNPSWLTLLASTEERANNRIKLVHNKIPGDLTMLLLPVFYLISAYQNNFKGNLNLGKIMVKLADDGKEPAAHSLMLQ